MTFTSPIWLMLTIPLAVFIWRWPMPTRLLQILRTMLLSLVVLAMAGLSIGWPSRAGVVVVVADRSLSMPPGVDESHLQTVELLHQSMPNQSRLAVIGFASTPAIEQLPQSAPLDQFTHLLHQDASDLHAALETALSLIGKGISGRILLTSDGRHTGQLPIGVAAQAAARGIAIDYHPMVRSSVGDLAIERIDAPASVTPGQSYLITVWLMAPASETIQYELRRNGKRLAAGDQPVSTGRNRMTFRDRADHGGVIQYELTINASADRQDPVPENNIGTRLVGVEGPRPLLCVTHAQPTGLADLLRQGNLAVTAKRPSECDWSLAALANYCGVIVENIRADELTRNGMEQLATWVTETGSGLMLTGGQRSYAPGGYYKSPLDPILPVSMELRREHRKLRLAMVIALDRSGSMTAPVGAGRTKMDLANLGTVEALSMLGPTDEFGCLAVDSQAHVITDLTRLDDKKELIRSQVLSINSAGGGIFIYEALTHAVKLLQKAEAETRHIILFADAMDSEQPGDYQKLLAACRQTNITVSVIGLGTPGDVDAGLLEDIARRGDGRIFFSDQAIDLPRLFAQDTFVVARSTFIEEPTSITPTAGLLTLIGQSLENLPPLGGYNLCYLKPSANLAMISQDEYQAPIVSSWQAGLGRVLCYAAETDGEFTGPVGRWAHYGTLLNSLARWVAGRPSELPDHLLLTQHVESGTCQIKLHIDPESMHPSQAVRGLPLVTTLRGRPGESPSIDRSTMQWHSPETLEIEIPLHGKETVLSTVQIPGHDAVSLPPVCRLYSPEFRPVPRTQAQKTLANLARTTGGQLRTDVTRIWQDLPKTINRSRLAPWLILLAIALLLVEIFERRTSLISAMISNRRSAFGNQKASHPASEESSSPQRQKAKPTTRTPTQHPNADQTLDKSPIHPQETGGVSNALQQAQKRTRDRT